MIEGEPLEECSKEGGKTIIFMMRRNRSVLEKEVKKEGKEIES